MKIKVRCDCGKTLVASDQLAGKKTKCPACGAVLRLPLLDETSEQSAGFRLTETGLNLTDDPQEDCAAPGEEMPPTFNFSETEHTSHTSPDCESSHGDSDTSKPMKEKPGRELSTIPKLWAAFIRLPLTGIEEPIDPRRVGEPVVDQHGSAASPAGCPPVYGRLVGKPVIDKGVVMRRSTEIVEIAAYLNLICAVVSAMVGLQYLFNSVEEAWVLFGIKCLRESVTFFSVAAGLFGLDCLVEHLAVLKHVVIMKSEPTPDQPPNQKRVER